MTYLPGLRDSLVKAAGERYGDVPEPERRHRLPSLTVGGIATVLAAAVAVAVAVVALVGLGGRHASASRDSSPAAATRADLHVTATQTLGRVALPPGAAPSGLVRGTPAELWSPSSELAIPDRVDVYRIWRLRQTPERVISFIEAHRPPGSSVGIGTGSSYSNSSSGRPAVIQMTESVSLGFPAIDGGIWRELALDAVTLRSGGTALRVDGEAGWLAPRPAAEFIPSGVVRVRFWFTRRGHQYGPVIVANPRRVRALVSLLNSLPAASAGTGGCNSAENGSLNVAFEGGEVRSPLAIATWPLSCRYLELTIGGRQIRVTAGTPAQLPGEQIVALLVPPLGAGHLSGSSATGSATVHHSSTTISQSPHSP